MYGGNAIFEGLSSSGQYPHDLQDGGQHSQTGDRRGAGYDLRDLQDELTYSRGGHRGGKKGGTIARTRGDQLQGTKPQTNRPGPTRVGTRGQTRTATMYGEDAIFVGLSSPDQYPHDLQDGGQHNQAGDRRGAGCDRREAPRTTKEDRDSRGRTRTQPR
jgi:hypothetical protein